jgi:hypothetical protein
MSNARFGYRMFSLGICPVVMNKPGDSTEIRSRQRSFLIRKPITIITLLRKDGTNIADTTGELEGPWKHLSRDDYALSCRDAYVIRRYRRI